MLLRIICIVLLFAIGCATDTTKPILSIDTPQSIEEKTSPPIHEVHPPTTSTTSDIPSDPPMTVPLIRPEPLPPPIAVETSPTSTQENQASTTSPITIPTPSAPPQIRFIHFGAWEANVLPGGALQAKESRFPELVSLLEKRRSPNTIVCSTGDIFSGEETNDRPVLEAMEILGLQVMALSNLELNYTKKIKDKLGKAKFITLSANLYEGNDRLFAPYLIKEVEGNRVGIIGITTEEAAIQVAPEKIKGLTFRDPIREVQQCLEELKNKADIFIVLSNMRHPRDLELAQACPNLHAILGRYDLESQHLYTKVGEVIISRIHHKQGREVAELSLEKKENRWSVSEKPIVHFLGNRTTLGKLNNNVIINFVEEMKLSSHTQANEFVERWYSQRKELLEVLCGSEDMLDGEYQNIRQYETNLGNLIADILLESRPGADVAVVNSGCIRASIKAGPITRGLLQTVLPYNNNVMEVEVSGETLQEMLENSVAQYEKVAGAFLQVSNINFKFDPQAEKFNRVQEIEIQGEPIDLERIYRLVTLEYLVQGGDDYVMLKGAKVLYQFEENMQKIVENYLKNRATVKMSCEGRIVNLAKE